MVHLLADHPHLINAVALMRWREWGRDQDLTSWIRVTVRETGRDELPVTWVAVDNDGEALGAVAIGDHEDVGPDLSPWVWGLVVGPDVRRQGIGRRLIDQLIAYAESKGYPQVWVATGPTAVGFYERCGFAQVDQKGDTTVLVRALSTGTPISAGKAESPSAQE